MIYTLSKVRILIQKIIIFTLGFLPPLFFFPIKILNEYYSTLYREPKLYLIGALAWLLLAISTPRRSIIAIGLSLIGFLSILSILWAPVKEAVLYEVFQYVNLVVLSITLVYFFRERTTRYVFLTGLIMSMTVALFIGLCQWSGISFSWLKPIGIAYPSTFGARHCAALAICGSIFFILIPCHEFLKKKNYVLVTFFIFLFALYFFYILILGSRTAYFGLIVGSLAGALISMKYFSLSFKKVVIIGIIILITFATAYRSIEKNDYVMSRLYKTLIFFKQPLSFFQTERWIWWYNSFKMLEANPLGVGAGNWGIAYPIYRSFHKFIYFTDYIQVRRPHNDYLQILCELGPIGLLLFFFILFKSLFNCWYTFDRYSSIEGGIIFIQLVSWIGLMCFDYPFEMPFQRFLLVMIMLLAEGQYNELVL